MTDQLTIGIDARAAAEVPAGRGRLVRELLNELAARAEPHRYRLYARTAWGELDERFEWVLLPFADPWWNVVAGRRASRECDAFLSSNSYLTSWFTTTPTVLVVHDMIGFDRALRPSQRSMIIERLTLGFATLRARGFISYSNATTSSLVARFPRTAGRIWLAPLGVSKNLSIGAASSVDDAAPAATIPESGFVLAVGTLEPRKNLPRLVAAYSALPEDLRRQHPLVVVGPLGWETGETLEALRSLGDDARLLGYVSDATLAELYGRCTVFCYPSLGEGFGLPILEAMAGGAAVVTSNVSSMPEVGGDAVEYADPRDTNSIRDALRRVLEDEPLRRELKARARLRAAQFSWGQFAGRTLEVLEYVAGRRAAPVNSAPPTELELSSQS